MCSYKFRTKCFLRIFNSTLIQILDQVSTNLEPSVSINLEFPIYRNMKYQTDKFTSLNFQKFRTHYYFINVEHFISTNTKTRIVQKFNPFQFYRFNFLFSGIECRIFYFHKLKILHCYKFSNHTN